MFYVFDQSVLNGAYHMRDDTLLLYEVIRAYVKNYVMPYYGKLADNTTKDVIPQLWIP